ncbi:FAD-dependent oxidoreductase [Formosa sp. PL04]|uniref:FAD-dependent oxidoreductase n=1 Tax=Formosa sp. PL04 TaxID=3081755 RepID=UPI0029820B44|nr:FAD-dependent oxidoreductase [Formosa sp. PL04]MDW5290603.1 FAD-dependent oxidoreductase [Formosa sp. PL04]
MDRIYNVGIIGGGVSGVVIALQLAKYGVDTILFEQEKSVVNGPPFCHLHAGGNLYPDISEEQCKVLMKQSIEMARLFPQSIDERPTFISIPKTEKYGVDNIEHRLDMLVAYYKELIAEDPENRILGNPEDYYKIYTEDDLIALSKHPNVKRPNTSDEWMTNTIKLIDYKKLKTPVYIVQEYGWNLFRLAAQAQLALNKTEKCNLKTNTNVTNIKDVRNENLDYNWEISTNDSVYKVNYLVNSCGFKTGIFDESLDLNTERLIEFKAAYVSKWQPIAGLIPELIFHGERGTPNGMAQLTPYSDDFYQIHGMTNDITLFENGLVQSKDNAVQPEFNKGITKKLNRSWDDSEIKTRTENAIEFVSKFVPSFKSATVGGPPLYGAQQIPGDDPSLRVGEVSFPCKSYARSEIIKASSALTVANQIINKIQEEGIIPRIPTRLNQNVLLDSISKTEIDILACELAIERGYPEALARLVIDKN